MIYKLLRLICGIFFIFLEWKVVAAQEVENSSMKREFKEVIKEEWRFLPSDYDLFRAEIYTISKDYSALYIFDYTKRNLFKLSIQNGEVVDIEEVGNGQGAGPGEFRNPTDMCISATTKGEKLVVIDSELARVSIWDVRTGKFENSFNPKKFVPFRISCNNDKLLIYNTSGSKDGNYLIYNFDKELVVGIKDDRVEPNTFLDAGEVVGNESSIYFASTGRSELKKFSITNKTLELSNSLVDAIVDNKTDIKVDKRMRIEKRHKDFQFLTAGIGEFKEYIMVLYSGEKHGHGKSIDFYNKHTLNYEFSTQLEFWSNYMSVQGNMIVLDSFDDNRKERMLMAFSINLEE